MPSLRRRRASRRGMTVILVLGLLAITLSLSYAMLRTQTTSARIQANQNRRLDARQAAMTGMQIALRRMHEANWAGVETPVTGSLGTGVAYSVTFTTGDATLTADHPEREKYPYRVTLTSIGSSVGVDGANGSTHTVQTVVEFVPRALSSQPSNWAALQNSTVRQWGNHTALVHVPVRIEGLAHLQGPLSLCPDYPPDCRPWDGVIDEVGVFNRALNATEISNLTLMAILNPQVLLPSAYSSAGPAHWWRLNEASGASTASASAGAVSGSFQNGAIAGASGISSRGAEFDGFNDYIDVGNFDVIGNQLSLVAFFRADSWNGSTDARILSKAVGTAEHETYWMLSTTQSGSAMRLRFRVRAGGSTKTLIASSGNLSAGTWYLATAVYNGSEMVLYLNGVEVGRTTKSGNLETNSSAPVYIGECPPGSARTRYLRDLEAMRAAGLGDKRPFSGPVELPRWRSDAHTLSMLEGDLATATTNVAATTAAPLAHPGVVASYRLYPGGKSYAVATLPHETLATDLAPNVETNPLGIFRRSGKLILASGVSVQGTIMTTGLQADICVEGDQVELAPVSLPPLYGSTSPIELPVAMATDDVRVRPYTGTSIRGYVMASDEFSWDAGDSDATCTLEGKLLCNKLKLYGRTDWQAIADTSWESWLTQFINQLGGSNPVPHFNTWVDDEEGYCHDPLLTIRPATTAVTYHWQDWTQPIFAAHASDAGLVWKIIRWVDDP